jgi:hypothetical protein
VRSRENFPERISREPSRSHERNDEAPRCIYIGRRFKNDMERLEYENAETRRLIARRIAGQLTIYDSGAWANIEGYR